MYASVGEEMVIFWEKICFWSLFSKMKITFMTFACFIISLFAVNSFFFSSFLSRGIRMHIAILIGAQNEGVSKNAKITHILNIGVFQTASNCFFRNIKKQLFFVFAYVLFFYK